LCTVRFYQIDFPIHGNVLENSGKWASFADWSLVRSGLQPSSNCKRRFAKDPEDNPSRVCEWSKASIAFIFLQIGLLEMTRSSI
jgi:hypothetical protein